LIRGDAQSDSRRAAADCHPASPHAASHRRTPAAPPGPTSSPASKPWMRSSRAWCDRRATT